MTLVPVRGEKQMRCYDCGERVRLTPATAKQRGWRVWFGGARCPLCIVQRRARRNSKLVVLPR